MVVLKEKGKDIVNQGCKYIDLRSSYFMLLPFFQFLIQKIITISYSEDNQEFLDKELPKRFKNPENVQELYDLFEQYVNLDLQVSQEKIKYFIAYNLNDEVNEYTCYIKTIKQSNEFEGNKELLLIK